MCCLQFARPKSFRIMWEIETKLAPSSTLDLFLILSTPARFSNGWVGITSSTKSFKTSLYPQIYWIISVQYVILAWGWLLPFSFSFAIFSFFYVVTLVLWRTVDLDESRHLTWELVFICTLTFSLIDTIYLQIYLFNPPHADNDWVFSIEFLAIIVFPVIGDAFESLVGLVGGIFLTGFKSGWSLVNNIPRPISWTGSIKRRSLWASTSTDPTPIVRHLRKTCLSRPKGGKSLKWWRKTRYPIVMTAGLASPLNRLVAPNLLKSCPRPW